MKTECRNCLYYDGGEITGVCRRVAPSGTTAVWPMVYPHDWCGEFSRREPRKKSEKVPNADKVIACYVEVWKDLFGSTPRISPEDAGAAKTIAKGRPLKEALWIVTEFLQEPPSWNSNQGNMSLKFIPGSMNTILQRKR